MYYDCHTHTCFSHDASQDKTPSASCKYAYEHGFSGIAFTEHADLRVDRQNRCTENIKREFKEVEELKKQYDGKMKVLMGVEIADVPYEPEVLNRILGICNYDILLCSVHLIEYQNKVMEMAVTDFSKACVCEMEKMLTIYYEDMRKSLYTHDFNVICHLTYPLRYFNKKYSRGVSLDCVAPIIDDIIKIAVDKNTALEINTSKATEDDLVFCPSNEFVRMYKSSGGTLFTLGSDSHVIGTEGNMFDAAFSMLKSEGIDKCCYFENGKPRFYSI